MAGLWNLLCLEQPLSENRAADLTDLNVKSPVVLEI